MSNVRRERFKGKSSGGVGFKISMPFESGRRSPHEVSLKYKGRAYKRPRQWRYITKPFFMRIKEPVIDFFKEAEEVQIIIDCGNFRKGELNFGLKSRTYIISGKHEDCEFREEIPLPFEVDIKKIKEIFRNDILEIILPKKRHNKKEQKK